MTVGEKKKTKRRKGEMNLKVPEGAPQLEESW